MDTTSWSRATMSAAVDVSASTHFCVLVTDASRSDCVPVLTDLDPAVHRCGSKRSRHGEDGRAARVARCSGDYVPKPPIITHGHQKWSTGGDRCSVRTSQWDLLPARSGGSTSSSSRSARRASRSPRARSPPASVWALTPGRPAGRHGRRRRPARGRGQAEGRTAGTPQPRDDCLRPTRPGWSVGGLTTLTAPAGVEVPAQRQ